MKIRTLIKYFNKSKAFREAYDLKKEKLDIEAGEKQAIKDHEKEIK